MATSFQIGDLTVQLTRKDVKNVHLSFIRPMAESHSSPLKPRARRCTSVRNQQAQLDTRPAAKARAQARETPRQLIERESHYVVGTPLPECMSVSITMPNHRCGSITNGSR